jgi:putative transposase
VTDKRGRAAAMFEAGMAQADIARALGLTRQTISRWHAVWRTEGAEGLAPNRRGPRSRLTDADLERVGAALAEGPQSYGFPDRRWSCRQVAWLIHRLTGVSYHPAHVCRLIHRHGWSIEPSSSPN